MTCRWEVVIVNLWCHKCFCSTLVRMLWLRISLYSKWIFYGKYPLNLLFCYICKYDYFFSHRAIFIELIITYHVNNCDLCFLLGAMAWMDMHDFTHLIYMLWFLCFVLGGLGGGGGGQEVASSTKMNCWLFTCASSKFRSFSSVPTTIKESMFDFKCSVRGRRFVVFNNCDEMFCHDFRACCQNTAKNVLAQ